MNRIQQYRQPVVTATGIFLGFMLEFINSWMPSSFSNFIFRDTVIGLGSISSIALLIIVLYRILRMNYPAQSEEAYYKKTLRFFLVGIAIPFSSLVLVMLQKLVVSLS